MLMMVMCLSRMGIGWVSQGNVQELEESLALYEKASSPRVNRGKDGACLVGQWRLGELGGST